MMLRESGIARPLEKGYSAEILLANQIISQLIGELLGSRATRASA